jgi:plasmid stabilization system protein ParE
VKHSVEIRQRARIDIRIQHAWMQQNLSRSSAEKWSDGIIARIHTLENDPAMWPLADESSVLNFELRVILYRRGRHVHRILFEVSGEKVIVHRVRHAAQDTLTADDF